MKRRAVNLAAVLAASLGLNGVAMAQETYIPLISKGWRSRLTSAADAKCRQLIRYLCRTMEVRP